MTEINWAVSHLEPKRVLAEPVPFFGQPEIKSQLRAFMGRMQFPHTLLAGPPGVGKTQLARWIAGERREVFEEYMCPVNVVDLAPTGIVLLDEVHRQSNPEPLYPIMNSVTVTLIGATTRPENLEPAFRSRFFITLNMRPYDLESMVEMLRHYGGNKIGKKNEETLARAGAGNPRQLQRIITTATSLGTWNAEEVLAICRINADGLTSMHFDYLRELARSGRPMGVSQLSLLLYTDDQTVKEHERLLLDYDLVTLTPSGRRISQKGRKYLEASGW